MSGGGLSAGYEGTCICIGDQLARACGAAAILSPQAMNDTPIEPRVIVAQSGARHNYAVARALHERGCLEALYTDACLSGWPASVLGPWLRGGSAVAGRLRRRTVRGIPPKRVKSSWAVEVLPRLRRIEGHQRYVYQDELLGRAMLRWGFGAANTVYAMFGNGERFLEAARARGVKVVTDVFITPVGHRIEARERQDYPDWHEGGARSTQEIAAIEAKVRRCIELSDMLLCPSDTVVDGLSAYGPQAARKSVVLPYGHAVRYMRPGCPQPGRVLFAGAAELRKGIHYLAFAAGNLRDAGHDYTFIVAGGAPPRVRQHPAARHLRFLGHLDRERMDAQFLCADVFVLPTLAEGSASVVYEALAAGVPVVTTRSAGSVVTDGVEGFIVPERDSDAIARAVARIVEDRALRERMSAAARETAQRYTVERWGERLVGVLSQQV